MLTLILDTSGAYTTALVARGDEVLAASSRRDRSSTHLHAQIRILVEQLGLQLKDMSRIAVVAGPGSWTGLNIGVTSAKTLAQVLALPLVPISSLDVLATLYDSHAGDICVILGAGRQRVYCAWYSHGGVGRRSEGPAVLPFASWQEQISQRTAIPLIVEYGSAYQEDLRALEPAVQARHQDRLSPEAMAAVAARTRGLTGDDLLRVVPAYLQPSLFERDAATRPHADSGN